MLIVRRDRHHVTRHQPEPRMQRPRTLGARALSTRIRQGRPSPKGHENGDEQWPASHLFSRTPGMCRSSACSVHKQPLTGASKRHRVAQVGLWRASATGNLHPFDGRLRASCSIHRGPEDEARMLKPIWDPVPTGLARWPRRQRNRASTATWQDESDRQVRRGFARRDAGRFHEMRPSGVGVVTVLLAAGVPPALERSRLAVQHCAGLSSFSRRPVAARGRM